MSRVLFILAISFSSHAQLLESGPSNLSYDWTGGYAILLHERFGNYRVGLLFLSEQTARNVTCGKEFSRSERCDFALRSQLSVFTERIFKVGDFEFGIGPAYFSNTNRVSSKHLMVGLMVGYYFHDRWALRVRHWSNAGTGSPNLGQDMITLGYRF